LWWQQERKARKAVVMAEQAQQQAAQSESGVDDSKKPWTRRPGNWTQVNMRRSNCRLYWWLSAYCVATACFPVNAVAPASLPMSAVSGLRAILCVDCVH
jgi:hypothetical protein